jgi:hydrogenase-4 component E
MTNADLINSLSGLLILSSLLVIETRRLRTSAIYYSVQSLVLVVIFLALAVSMHAEQLYWWAASAFITKAVLVPYIIFQTQKRTGGEDVPTAIKPTLSILLAAASLVVSFVVINQLDLKIAVGFKPALAVSVAHFFFGQLCILTQRNLLKQVMGFCLMENGSHLTLALMAYDAPELVEIGIATDAVFGVLIMAVLVVQIYRKLNTLDAASLTTLKG